MIYAGIFVGGRARRMGGRAKGLLLTASGETIVARWERLFHSCGIPVVLVGESSAYGATRLERVPDDPSASGPLAGLLALLEYASGAHVIVVACDMPSVSAGLLERLVCAPPAPIVAPRREGRWEPLFARYDASRVLPVARAHAASGQYALRDLLDACAVELRLGPDESHQLEDWDSPADLPSDP